MHYKQELISSGSKTNITKNTFGTGWLDHCGGKPKIWQVVSKSLASEVGLLNLEFTIYCEATTIARFKDCTSHVSPSDIDISSSGNCSDCPDLDLICFSFPRNSLLILPRFALVNIDCELQLTIDPLPPMLLLVEVVSCDLTFTQLALICSVLCWCFQINVLFSILQSYSIM